MLINFNNPDLYLIFIKVNMYSVQAIHYQYFEDS